jgi:uncharacterized protein YjbI with pentapeptide repeats
VDSSARDVEFSQAILAKASFGETSLSGASFNGADLTDADFRTAKGYSIHPLHTKVKGARFSYPEALVLLSALGVRVDLD